MVDKATELGGAAVAALGAAVGTAALAVEKATGVDLHHGSPVSWLPDARLIFWSSWLTDPIAHGRRG
jgi:hypothetical protein